MTVSSCNPPSVRGHSSSPPMTEVEVESRSSVLARYFLVSAVPFLSTFSSAPVPPTSLLPGPETNRIPPTHACAPAVEWETK